MLTTRFAPSPTGYLHLGHALSAWWSHTVAATAGGIYRLRLEDLDDVRSSQSYEDALLEDLDWLGLNHSGEVVRQSERANLYQAALSTLDTQGLIYPCFCSRKEIANANARQGHQFSDLGHGSKPRNDYPGTCRHLSSSERMTRKDQGLEWRWRLNSAITWNASLSWSDIWGKTHAISASDISDIPLTTRSINAHIANYHLAVVVDDALQGITCVTRGDDLLFATPMHRVLQHALSYSPPIWAHHPLIWEPDGSEKLSKRKRPESIRDLRKKGLSSQEVLYAAQSAVTLPQL